MKVITLGLVVLLALAFTANEQQKTAAVVTCGQVSGGTTIEAKGVDWAQDFGNWIHELATTPIDSSAVKAAVEGVEKVLWYWIRTWFLSSKGLQLDPSILKLQQDAADARAAAEAQCTPCPTALPQDSSPLASLGAAPMSGSPEEVTRQVAARYWPADQVDTAVAVAGAESTFNPKAHNNYGAGVEGLWQINVQAHRDLVAGKDLQDPSVNAYVAHQIWLDAGKSWRPWTTYTSGSYRKFLKPSAAAKLTAAVSDGQPKEQSDTPDGQSDTPTNPQNVGCQSSGMPQVRVATWNTYCGASRATGCNGGRLADRVVRVLGGMQAIAKQADIINTQEMSNAELRQRVLRGLDGFSMVGGDTSHPMYVRDSVCTVTSDKSDLVFTRGTPMEGPDQGNRWVNTAVLNCGGKVLTDINFHQLPKIQKGGGLNKAWPKRIEQATNIFAAAMTSARQHVSQGAVVVTADANFDGDPNGMYAAAGLTSALSVFGPLKQATRTRDIDQILWSAGAPASERVLPAHGSDHSPRVVTFLGANDTSPTAAVAGMRSVTDPTSHKTYQVQIPAGPRGVAINYAIDQLGKKYVWGAHGPNAFDCSGLMSAAWGKAGVEFTPQTEAMFREIPPTSSPQPGDITYHPGHVQMVLNDGLILEAANPRVPLRIIDKNWMKPTAYFDPTKMSGAAT